MIKFRLFLYDFFPFILYYSLFLFVLTDWSNLVGPQLTKYCYFQRKTVSKKWKKIEKSYFEKTEYSLKYSISKWFEEKSFKLWIHFVFRMIGWKWRPNLQFISTILIIIRQIDILRNMENIWKKCHLMNYKSWLKLML